MATSRNPAKEILDISHRVEEIKAILDPITAELKTVSGSLKSKIMQMSASELAVVSADCMSKIEKIKTLQTKLLVTQKSLNDFELPKLPAAVEAKQTAKSISDLAKEISAAATKTLTANAVSDIGILLEKLKTQVKLQVENNNMMITVYSTIKSKSDAIALAKSKAQTTPAQAALFTPTPTAPAKKAGEPTVAVSAKAAPAG